LSEGHFESCQKYVDAAEGGANFTVVDGKPVLKSAARADRGGPTKYGITARTLAAAASQGIVSHGDIVKLTRAEADAIYRANYWGPSKAGQMKWGLCLVHYDCAVNCGVSRAARLLQRALCNLGAALAVDGVIGPRTLAALEEYNTDAVVEAYLAVREAYYRGLVERNPRQGVFLNGWLNRLERVRKGATS